jgi:hypothetical protein
MLCSCFTIRVTNYSDSMARRSGSRWSLPGITTSTGIPLGSGLLENSTLRNGLFTGIQTRGIAFRILHIVEPYRGHE